MKRIFQIIVVLTLLVIIALPFYYATEKQALSPEIRAQATGDFIQLSQGITHYQQANLGADKTVVLVHGFSVPYYIWDPTFDFLAAQGFHVIRYDLFGRGYSDRPDMDYDQVFFDRQLMDLLQGLKINKPIDIIGLSMGGAIVAKFVADHPKKVNKVIFVDPSHQPFNSKILNIPMIGEYLMRVVKMPTAAQGQLGDFYAPENYPNWVKKYKVQMQYEGFSAALLSTLRNFAKPDKLYLFEKVGKSNIPNLLIWGEQDMTLPIEKSPRVAKALKTQTFRVAKAGHLPHYEHPEIVNPKLLSFLRAK